MRSRPTIRESAPILVEGVAPHNGPAHRLLSGSGILLLLPAHPSRRQVGVGLRVRTHESDARSVHAPLSRGAPPLHGVHLPAADTLPYPTCAAPPVAPPSCPPPSAQASGQRLLSLTRAQPRLFLMSHGSIRKAPLTRSFSRTGCPSLWVTASSAGIPRRRRRARADRPVPPPRPARCTSRNAMARRRRCSSTRSSRASPSSPTGSTPTTSTPSTSRRR